MNHKCDIITEIPCTKTVTPKIHLSTPYSYSQYFHTVPTICILRLKGRTICVFKLLLSHLQDKLHVIQQIYLNKIRKISKIWYSIQPVP